MEMTAEQKDQAEWHYSQWVGSMPGYRELTAEEIPKGECGASELAMHCRIVGQKIKRVWVNDKGTYAYVLLQNGKGADGCWTAHASGDWSIS